MILEWQALGTAAIAALLAAALVLLKRERRNPARGPAAAATTTDSLTGLRDRSSLERELRQFAVPRADAAVLWLDLDHFKQINDSRGHDAGDRALKDFADVIRSQVRGSDIAARYGGDDFVIVLPTGGQRGASSLASRLLEATRRLPSSAGRLTVSIGIAAGSLDSSVTWDVLLKRADEAMYRAKQAGRDRVEE